MSMKFMNLKSFHPGNKRNRKKKFIAEENHKNKSKKEIERAREFQEEQEFIKNRELLTGSKIEGEKVKVGFLYAPPPGYQGDLSNNDNDKKKEQLTDAEKFPCLAGAPVAGEYTEGIKVTHKPFGIQLRDVKCVRCNQYGHKSGDRECPLLEINPQESKRLQLEDPLYIKANNNNNVNNVNNTNSNPKNQYKFNNNMRMNPNAQSPKSFGPKEFQDSYLNEYIQNEIEDEEDDDEVERRFLASLTPKQRKLLLRQIKLEEKLKQKEKQKKRKLDNSDSSDDSSESESSSESDREYTRKKKKYKKSSSKDR